MREYLLKIMEQKVESYLAQNTPAKDGVDGLMDLYHSFLDYLGQDEDYLDNEKAGA